MMKKVKKLFCYIVILSMLISLFPEGSIILKVDAAASATVVFQRIQDPTGKNTQQYVISYSSDIPINKPIIKITDGNDGGIYVIDTTKYPEQSLVRGSQIIIEQSLVNAIYQDYAYAAIFNEGRRDIQIINHKTDGTLDDPVNLSIYVVTPPMILGSNIVNKLLYVGDQLSIYGSNFTRAGGNSVGMIMVDGVSYTDAVINPTGDTISLTVKNAGIKTGEIRLYENTGTTTLTGVTNLPNAIQTIYQNSVYVVSKLTDIDIVQVQPNTGSVNGGTYVKLKNSTDPLKIGLTEGVKVYFPRIINGVMEPLSDANLATGNTFDSATNTLTVRTKASTSGPGDARIVITSVDGTSRYDDSSNPLTYTFVEADNVLTINDVTPASAKASSEAMVAVVGKNIVTFNISGLTYPVNWDAAANTTVKNVDPFTTVVTRKGLIFQYNNHTYNVNVTKTIRTVIGGSAVSVLNADGTDFAPESYFSTQQDQLYVKLPVINLGTKEFETYDAVVSTETFINDADIDGNPLVIPSQIEEATLSGAFTYNSDFIQPTVTSITPNYGPKDAVISVTIKGKNFYVLQQDTQRLYPTVKISTNPTDAGITKVLQNIRVYNSTTGIEVDGSASNYRGDIIKGDIPVLPTGNTFKDSDVYVYNPDGGQPGILTAAFTFMDPSLDDYPRIISVTPNLVSTKGGEAIVVTGSNFKTNSEVYINGERVLGITINGTMQQITFKAPPGKSGVCLLQVFNPDNGAVASATFEYTSVYTSPKISLVSPNKGGSNTLTTITGSNFMGIDVTAKPNELYKIIGTRVTFNGADLNTYNRNASGAIILSDYVYKQNQILPVIKNVNESAVLEELFKDTVLVDGTTGIFTIAAEDGNVILRDSKGNKYRAYIDSGAIRLVDQNGVASDAIAYSMANAGATEIMTFTINNVTYNLAVKTPYNIKTDAVNGNTIIGRRVRVISSGIIEATVPPLVPIQGYNDVTVINPDTAYDTKIDGFFYFSSQNSQPVIDSLFPAEGSIAGGTVIKIIGSDFRSGIVVYFGSQKSPQIIVSADEKTIYAVLPPYPTALPKGQSSVDVPVVLVNESDGGSYVWDKRFTYRVPTSYPEISTISPSSWNASGGTDVIIYGKNFMQGEPYTDVDGNNQYDVGEPYIELNNNGAHDTLCTVPVTVDGVTTLQVIQELAPRVYFGGELAKVKDFKYNRLIVTLPKYSSSGSVDVVVVNPDTGTYVKKSGFNYQISSPKITTVVPAVGPKTGGTEVCIFGDGFITGDSVDNSLVQVFVGDSNDIGQEVISGGSLSKQISLGNMVVDYNSVPEVGHKNTSIEMTYKVKAVDGIVQDIKIIKEIDLNEEKKDFFVTFTPDDFAGKTLGVVPTPMAADANELSKIILGDETIRLSIKDGIFFVTRRMATVDELNSSNKMLLIYTPPSATIGVKNLTVFNNDGGTASSKFEYGNPISNPKIDGITPYRQVYYISDGLTLTKNLVEVGKNGGDEIRIEGQDFRDNVSVMVGDQQATVVSRSDLGDNKYELLVKVPAPKPGSLDKELKVTVINPDTASVTSTNYIGTRPTGWYPYWLVYRTATTSPKITSITPNKGPKIGGTYVSIKGSDFRPGARVFIGGIECTDVTTTGDGTTITAKTARLEGAITASGAFAVEVKNYENGVLCGNAILENAYTYISSPEINGIYETGSMNFDGNYYQGNEITSLKISGDEVVMLEVDDLLPNPTVIIGGKIETISDYNNIPTGLKGIDKKGNNIVVTGGAKATVIRVQDLIYVVIRTPANKLDSENTIIVVNTDGGISSPYAIPYIKPIPNSPSKPLVQVVDADTIKVEWGRLDNVFYYELYASEGYGKTASAYKYLGSIEPFQYDSNNLRYYVNGLKSSTWYRFKIKSVNLFGASEYSVGSEYVKTKDTLKATYYQQQGQYSGSVPQQDTIKINGSIVDYTAGESSISSAASGLLVYFNQPKYSASKTKTVGIGVDLLKKYSASPVIIYDKNLKINLKTGNLIVDEVNKLTSSQYADSKVTIIINNSLGAKGDEIRIKVPVGYRVITAPFGINLGLQVGKEKSSIKSFKGSISLNMQYDEILKLLYPGGVYIAYYNNSTKKIQLLPTTALKGNAEAKIISAGEYLLLGKMMK